MCAAHVYVYDPALESRDFPLKCSSEFLHVVNRLVKQRSGTTADGRLRSWSGCLCVFFRLEGNLVVIQFWMGEHCRPIHQSPSDFHFSGLGRCTIKSWLNRLTRIMYRKSMEICYGGCSIRTHVGQDGEDRRHGSLYSSMGSDLALSTSKLG